MFFEVEFPFRAPSNFQSFDVLTSGLRWSSSSRSSSGSSCSLNFWRCDSDATLWGTIWCRCEVPYWCTFNVYTYVHLSFAFWYCNVLIRHIYTTVEHLSTMEWWVLQFALNDEVHRLLQCPLHIPFFGMIHWYFLVLYWFPINHPLHLLYLYISIDNYSK